LVGRYSSSLEEVPVYTILLPNPKTGRAVLEPVERTIYLHNLALKCFQNATPLERLLLSRWAGCLYLVYVVDILLRERE
jgi:hypothetical protein